MTRSLPLSPARQRRNCTRLSSSVRENTIPKLLAAKRRPCFSKPAQVRCLRVSAMHRRSRLMGRCRLEAFRARGKRILVTRAAHQAGKLSEGCAHSGAEPVEVPVLEIRPPADYAELDRAFNHTIL